MKPAQFKSQVPVAAECKFDTESMWLPCAIEHHHLVQSEPHKWPEYQTRLLYTTPPPVAEPHKQEPVAWMYEVNGAHTILDLFEPPDDAYDEGTLHPLYTTLPQRKPLTDKELNLIGAQWHYNLLGKDDKAELFAFARAIEAAHQIYEDKK